MTKARDPQLDLFAERAPQEPARTVGPAPVADAMLETARRLPAGIYLGTSSWHFPGWARLVYDRLADERVLAREGLVGYAQHPLLRCAGIDRTFYAPIPAAELRRYAEQVPAAFRFVVKAPMLCTAVVMRADAGVNATPNARFLDAAFAVERFIAPCLEGLEDKAGALVFQFPPVGREYSRKPQAFAERLAQFLGALPRGPVYAVELRDPALITELAEQIVAAAAHVGVQHRSA